MSDQPMETTEASPSVGRARRGRRGGARRAAQKAAAGLQQQPFRQMRNTYPLTNLISADQVEAIHRASLRILKETGIEFMGQDARDQLKKAGADVDEATHRVRFDPALVESMIGLAPKCVTLHAPNPERNIHLGDNWVTFCAVASAPNVADLDNGRRTGNFHDFKNLIRVGHQLNTVQMWGGYPVEPVDLHASTRHLDATHAFLTMSDKAIHGYSLGPERLFDVMDMVCIRRGVSREQLMAEPSMVSIVNANSPLKYDQPMAEGIMNMAETGQIIVVTPFTLAGAMAPVTLAGALAQQNAEALAGLVLSQSVKAGAPFVYGGFTSNVDMKSGAPAFGTPEYMKGVVIGGQMARRYGLPYRTSGVNAANGLDMQAGWESVFSLWSVINGGGNMIKHALGWMEGGLQASFEKMILDADMIQMVQSYLEPIGTSEADFAFDAIEEVGPGGHFFGCAHTQARYKDAFYQPMISDWRNYETWEDAGQPMAPQKANAIYHELLASYEAPAIDPAITEELTDFVARRHKEGGAPTDF